MKGKDDTLRSGIWGAISKEKEVKLGAKWRVIGAVLVLTILVFGAVSAWGQPNPTFVTRDKTGNPATNISIGWERNPGIGAQSGTDAIHVTTTAATTDYAMVGVATNFVLSASTAISYWGYTVADSDVMAPDEIWLEFTNGDVICNTHPGGTPGEWVEWTLSGSSNWYIPSLTPSSINIADYYGKTVTRIFLGAGSPTSAGVTVDVYLDNLSSNGTTLLDDDTGTIEVLCGTFCGYTGCTGIQVGIDAALTGDSINVAAGTYDEQVVIEKNLTLQGAGDTTILQPTQATVTDDFQLFHRRIPGHTSGDGKTAAIIVVNDVNGADSVTIKNIKIDALNVGTTTSTATKFVEMLCTGSNATIDGVTFYGNLDWPDDALYLTPWDQTAVTVEVKNCDFSRFWFNAITANFTGLTANIHHNTITGRGENTDTAGNGIQYGWGCTGTASYNTISDLAYISETVWVDAGIMFWSTDGTASHNTIIDCQTGILVQAREAGTFTVTVENNTISAPGLTAAVPDIEGINVSANENNPSITATIQGNDLSGGGLGDGIGIGLSEGGDSPDVTATISNNEISGWKKGIWLGGSTGTVTITGNTITNNNSTASGIHVLAGVDVSDTEAHFNNIEGNTGHGVYNGGTGTLNATDNWWGDASGPSGEGSGTGDAVSTNVDFDPWTGMSTETVVFDADVGQGETVENAAAGTSVHIDSGTGLTDVTIAQYTSPPDVPSFGAGATYVDVQLSNPSGVQELTITFEGMAAGTVIYFYLPGTGWIACSHQTQVGGTITVTVTDSTVPTLAQLTGTIFAEGTALGNVNGDGVIDVLDVRLCLQIATGFIEGTGAQRASADVDGDGDVDLTDAQILAEYIIGIRTALPGGGSV